MSKKNSDTSNLSLKHKIIERDNSFVEFSSSVSCLKDEETNKLYSVIISTQEIDKVKESKLESLVKRSNINGFRPGKAPKSFIWNNHKEGLTHEVIQDVINHSLSDLVKEKTIAFLGDPKITVKSEGIENGISYEVSFMMAGEIKIPDFNKIKINKPVFEVTDKDIDARIDELFERNKKFEKADAKHKSKKGDRLVIDFEGKINGEIFQGGTASNHTLELGSGSFIGNFEEQLEGKKSGDVTLVKVTFPTDYHSKDHAGKDAEFSVTVKEILAPKKIESVEALAEYIAFPSVEELKSKIKESLVNECSYKAEMLMKKELLDQLDKECDFAVPDEIVNSELEILKKQKVSENEKELSKIAKRRVKLGILISDVAKEKDVKVSGDDLKDMITREAMANPTYSKAIIDYYLKNKKAIESLHGPIIEEKTLKLIFNETNNIDKSTTVAELLAHKGD